MKKILYFFTQILLLNLGFITAATAQDINACLYKAINIPSDANHYFKPIRTITIAIVDDGLDLDDTILNKQLAFNKKEIPGNNIDDDNNGLIDDYYGWDFADNDNDVLPGMEARKNLTHGTALTEILYNVLHRLTGNGITQFKFLPVKTVADVNTNHTITQGYNGIEYAIQQKADVIVCAWSGGNFGEADQKIIEKAAASGAVIVCAAGNYQALKPLYPGAFPALIDVAAVTSSFKKLGISNYGQFIDIAAPGDSTRYWVNDPKDTSLHELSGTSAATPVVAAVVAALLASDSSLNALKIDRLIKNSAMPLEPFNPSSYAGNLGAGLINVDKLIQLWKQTSSIHDRYETPKGYIDLAELNKTVGIASNGNYKDYKLLFVKNNSNNKATFSNIKLQYFQKGIVYEKIFSADSFAYPKYVTADSFHLSFINKTNIHPGNYYWYYEAETIDSSILYCSGLQTIQADSGVIEDGSKEANYAGRCDCKWQIIVPEGKRIRITFKELDTEPKVDYVYVFNGTGTEQPILGMFSGNELPPVITSWDNKALIWFATNEFISGKGWKLEFKAVD